MYCSVIAGVVTESVVLETVDLKCRFERRLIQRSAVNLSLRSLHNLHRTMMTGVQLIYGRLKILCNYYLQLHLDFVGPVAIF